MASPQSSDSLPRWSTAAVVKASPRGKMLWRAFERSRTQVFVLTRTEQESFYGLESGDITPWQYSLALGALEKAVQQRGEAWDAVATFADELASGNGCAPVIPPVVLTHSTVPSTIQGCSSVGRTGRDDARDGHLRDLDRDVRSEGR